jgi:hypothetical protein
MHLLRNYILVGASNAVELLWPSTPSHASYSKQNWSLYAHYQFHPYCGSINNRISTSRLVCKIDFWGHPSCRSNEDCLIKLTSLVARWYSLSPSTDIYLSCDDFAAPVNAKHILRTFKANLSYNPIENLVYAADCSYNHNLNWFLRYEYSMVVMSLAAWLRCRNHRCKVLLVGVVITVITLSVLEAFHRLFQEVMFLIELFMYSL